MPLVLSGTVFGGQGHSTIYNMPKRTHGGTIKLKPKRTRYGPRRPVTRRRRIAKARPMRSLKTNYRALNVYRFVRETLPTTNSFTIIPQGTGSYGAMGYMSFENLQVNQLPGFNSDFANLFARYKVDKIVTKLTPMWQEQTFDTGIASTNMSTSNQLEITRVNTKFMNGDFPIAADAASQLSELAQLQCKSKSLYAAKKPLYLTTLNPGVQSRMVVDSAGNEVDARASCPWLALSGTHAAIDVPFKHNAIIFARRIDGSSLNANWVYSVTHKIYFRCSQVG